jgi:hypothetical protein
MVNGCVKVPSGTIDNASIAVPENGETELPEGGEEEEWEDVPSSDQASGSEPIPRYPGAIMTSYATMEGITSSIISYKTLSDFETVKEWYMSQKAWPEITIDEPEHIQIREITETEYLEVSIMRQGRHTSIGILWYTG